MFTGIVAGIGEVVRREARDGAARLVVDLGDLADEVGRGDSVALNRVCLTATTIATSSATSSKESRVAFDVIGETLRRTNLGALTAGAGVNVELSLRMGDRLGGHIVTGHVDGTGTIRRRERRSGETVVTVETDPELTRFMVEKGSVALDGVSLTLTAVDRDALQVALIPHTLEVTTLGRRAVDDPVNIEVDTLAKWVDRLLAPYRPPTD